MLLEKGGVTQEVFDQKDIARLKMAGYKEVVPVVEQHEPDKTPEEQNTEAIAEANKPIGSKKPKGGKA